MSGSPHERRVRIALGERSYQATVGRGLLARLGEIAGPLLSPGRRVMLAADGSLPSWIVERSRESLEAAGYRVRPHALPASETDKSLPQAEGVLRALSGARFERRDAVVALGGGIVGDLAGFAAAIYMRGIPWIQCPTTLLSMVDASVGGKTGVNLLVAGGGRLEIRKNMVGAIHQPLAVVADLDVLATLDDRDFRCGLAECVKHGMLAGAWDDPQLMAWTSHSLGPILARNPAVISELIARNVAVKAAVVRADEREDAPDRARMQLNLGHTFAHAIEAAPGLTLHPGPVRHGEAVSLGLIAAAECAEAAAICPRGTAERVRTLLEQAGLPVRIAGLPDDRTMLALMAHDKKVEAGRLRLVLPTGPTHAAVFEGVDEAHVAAGLAAIRS